MSTVVQYMDAFDLPQCGATTAALALLAGYAAQQIPAVLWLPTLDDARWCVRHRAMRFLDRDFSRIEAWSEDRQRDLYWNHRVQIIDGYRRFQVRNAIDEILKTLVIHRTSTQIFVFN